MKHVVLVALPTLVALTPFTAKADHYHCVSEAYWGCFDTIQEAVDAADPYDIITVYPASTTKGYTEAVTVTTPNITIQGYYTDASLQVVDGCETVPEVTDCGLNHGFTIQAENVFITGLTIRHANIGIFPDIGADKLKIRNVNFLRNQYAISTEDNAINEIHIRHSNFSHGILGNAIDITGNEAIVDGNTFISNEAIRVEGDDALVIDNFVNVTTDYDCVDVRGARAHVEYNTCLASDGGVQVVGDDGRIEHNTITDIPDDDQAIGATGNNMFIHGNRIERISEEGIELEGDHGTISWNHVERTGSDNDGQTGIEVRGNSNSIHNNYCESNAFAGIINEAGNDNVYSNNTSVDNGTSGIRVIAGDGVVIQWNTLRDNHGEGINVNDLATNTSVRYNTSTSNRTDICNDSGSSSISNNYYSTGGSGAACIVEIEDD